MMKKIAVCMMLALWLHPVPALALEGAWVKKEFSSVRVIAGGFDKQKNAVMAGLEIRMDGKWKTYWRNPGDAGLPLEFDYADSANIKEVKLFWPAPMRFIEPWGTQVIGYSGRVLFPLQVLRDDNDKPSTLKLNVRYSVCSDICVPYEETVSLDIPAALPASASANALIAAARAHVPLPKRHDLAIGKITIKKEEKGRGVLSVSATSKTAFKHPDLFVEAEGNAAKFQRPKINYSKDDRTAYFSVPYTLEEEGGTIAGKQLTLTLAEGKRAVETTHTLP